MHFCTTLEENARQGVKHCAHLVFEHLTHCLFGLHRSKDFMLVLATNRAEDLDAAILDRCDESIYFPLPDASCRKDLIMLYFNLHFRKFMETNNKQALSLRSQIRNYFTNKKPIIMSVEPDLMTGAQLESTVGVTRGFSGREIGKLMVALQGAMYVSKNGKLDFVTAWKLIETKVREHMAKIEMVGNNHLSRLDADNFSTVDDEADSLDFNKHEDAAQSPKERLDGQFS